jgi:Acetyltransferase (GNAT) domain
MNITIRAADLEADRQAIVDGVIKYLNPAAGSARFDWLYKNNPFGAPRVWLAVEGDGGSIVGALAAFPRQLSVRGHKETAWVLGDCWVADQYRSLGPVLTLQRACLREIDSGAARFCYDFPSAAMMAVYRRLQIKPCFQLVRMAKPLRIDRKLKQLVAHDRLHRALSMVGNQLLDLGEGKLPSDRNVSVSDYVGEFGSEFSELGARLGNGYNVYTQRTCDYLNWRYRDNPLCRYDVLIARRNGSLDGYAVLSQEDDGATLVDLFGTSEAGVLSALVNHSIGLMKRRGAQTLSAFVGETHPWRDLLQKHGFKTREATPVVLYAPPGGEITENGNWMVMSGDRDS